MYFECIRGYSDGPNLVVMQGDIVEFLAMGQENPGFIELVGRAGWCSVDVRLCLPVKIVSEHFRVIGLSYVLR